MAEPTDLREGDALVVVDVQPDFCPGGALPVPDGDAVIPVLNRWLEAAKRAGVTVVASRDWHPSQHPSFEVHGGPWPTHCVQGTPGAAFHANLKLPTEVVVINKGTRLDKDQYSAFDETGLGGWLKARDHERLFIGGLAEDVCVRATALDAVKAGFETHLIAGATRPVTPEGGEAAIAAMRQAGVVIEGRPRSSPPFDKVDEAGDETFPASDPPSFTPEKV
ncbi:MAG: nicotinamidase [Sandaracinaceae bacterium]|nr:nicotinamidase [Myxococcales bacterium]